MPKIMYEERRFRQDGLTVLGRADLICDDYARQGYRLTLRQLYYQFVARDQFPESWRDPLLGTKNTDKNYKKLGELISGGRIAGLIDWSHITDTTRTVRGGDGGYRDPEHNVSTPQDGYYIPKGTGPPHH